MDATDRRTSHDLSELLGLPASQTDFFQLVRWVERRSRRLYAEDDRAREHARGSASVLDSVGTGADPGREAVRFTVRPTLRFPEAPVRQARVELEVDETGARIEHLRWTLDVAFIGLVGPQGVLPQHYTETLLERAADKDTAFRDLLDLIHQRLVGFFYRSWRKHQLGPAVEAEADAEDRSLHELLLCLAGAGVPGVSSASGLPEELSITHAGQLSRSVAPAATIEQALSGFAGVRVRLESFVGRWAPIRRRDQGALGDRPDGSRALGLGQGFVLGSSSWDVTSRVRVHLGPMPFDEVSRYHADRPALGRMVSLFRQLTGPITEADFVVHTEREGAIGVQLGGEPRESGRLGWSSWLLDDSRPTDEPLRGHLGMPAPIGRA